MSYILDILSDKPQSAFVIDTTFTNKGPGGETGSYIFGTPTTAVGTARGTAYSGVFSNDITGKINSSPYNTGREDSTFSLEANIIPSNNLASPSTNLSVDPRGTANTPQTRPGAFNSGRWSTSITWTNNTGSGDNDGVDTYVRGTVATTQTSHGFHIASNPDSTSFPLSTVIACSPGDIMTFSAEERNSLGVGMFWAVAWINSGGNKLSTVSQTTVATTANVWKRITYTTPAAPLGTVACAVKFTASAAMGAGATIDGTGLVILKNAPYTSYFDGTSPNAVWNGTANNSTSSLSISDQQILSNNGQYDGLSINGTIVSFSTKYATTGSCKVSYDIQSYERLNIVGTHNANTNKLFINGVQVDQADITDAQKADTYITTDGALYIGNTTSSQMVTMSTAVTYNYELSPSKILAHYNSSCFDRDPDSVRSGNLFRTMNIDSIDLNKYIDFTYDLNSGWPVNNSCSIQSGVLYRSVDSSGTPIDSTVTVAVDLTDGVDTNIYGVVVDAVGEGFTLQCSIDNSTWITFTNNNFAPIITSGSNPIGETLLVRITLLASATTAFLESIQFRAYRSGVSIAQGDNLTNGKTMTIVGMSPGMVAETLDLNDLQGLSGSGSVTFSSDASGAADSLGTEEYWIKRLDNNSVTFSSGTTYINGVATSLSNLPVGLWSLVHIVKASTVDSSAAVSGNMILLSAGQSDLQLTSSQILAAYKSYLSADAITVVSTDTIGLTDAVSPAVTIYAKAWSISST